MSDLPWSDFTIEEWAEQLLSIGSIRDAIELESRARELARSPDNVRAQLYFEKLLDESCRSDLELQAFMALRDDERTRLAGGAA